MTRDYNEYWSSLTVSHDRHPGNRYRYRLIASELGRLGIRPRRVLDCGCGDGSLLAVVSKTIECGELHGMDVADNVPVARPGGKIHFRQQDLGRPVDPSLHRQFDLVLCSEVIEHVPDDKAVIANLAALAAPGGWVVLTTQTGTIYKTEQFLGHLRHYRLDDLGGKMSYAGLRVATAYRCGWPFLNGQKIAAHVLHGPVQKNIVQAKQLSAPVKGLFFVLDRVYRMSMRGMGPQLVITAQKPA